VADIYLVTAESNLLWVGWGKTLAFACGVIKPRTYDKAGYTRTLDQYLVFLCMLFI